MRSCCARGHAGGLGGSREFFDDDPDDLALYNSLVDDDGWCIHFDKQVRPRGGPD